MISLLAALGLRHILFVLAVLMIIAHIIARIIHWRRKRRRRNTSPPRPPRPEPRPVTASDRLSALLHRIDTKLELAGMTTRDDADAIRAALTQTESEILRVTNFMAWCDNNGRVYPHVENGLSIRDPLLRMGATGTVSVLEEFDRQRTEAIANDRYEQFMDHWEEHHRELEREAESEWESMLVAYAERNSADLDLPEAPSIPGVDINEFVEDVENELGRPAATRKGFGPGHYWSYYPKYRVTVEYKGHYVKSITPGDKVSRKKK